MGFFAASNGRLIGAFHNRTQLKGERRFACAFQFWFGTTANMIIIMANTENLHRTRYYLVFSAI